MKHQKKKIEILFQDGRNIQEISTETPSTLKPDENLLPVESTFDLTTLRRELKIRTGYCSSRHSLF